MLGCWVATRAVHLASVGLPGLSNIAFDEGQYLYESLRLAEGAAAENYKGPFLYLVTAPVFLISPSLAAARVVSLLLDAALMVGFALCQRRQDGERTYAGMLLLAACPLPAYFTFHLLTDVPLALFSTLCVVAFWRHEGPRGALRSSAWLTAALLVKSTALLLLPILVACAVLRRRPLRECLLAFLAPALVYLALPIVWTQTPDTHFLRALPWMSFRCGLLYFPLAAALAAGPALTVLAGVGILGARPAAGDLSAPAAATLGGLYVMLTAFGDSQPKYVMAMVPFMALLAAGPFGRLGVPWRAAVVAISVLWAAPAGRMLEADSGMTEIARFLGRLPISAAHTTIPAGVHQHAFAGALRFTTGLSLETIDTARAATAAAAPGGMALWTDWMGEPAELEQSLAGVPHRKLDFFTNKASRPVYLSGPLASSTAPPRIRWEPNLLNRDLVTPADRAVARIKRWIHRRLLRREAVPAAAMSPRPSTRSRSPG